MSDQRNPEEARECRICGKNGYVGDVCETHEIPLDQIRQYTLSELRAMDPEQRDRILHGDRPSGAAPKIVNVPGSTN
jgi:hypothetical protein